MTITLTNLTSGSSLSNPATTASISPTANEPVYAAVIIALGSSSGIDNTTTVSGCNLTWTEVGSGLTFGGRRKLRIFRGKGASPSSGTLSISVDETGATFNELMWVVDQGTGIDGTTPEGTSATDARTDEFLTVTVSGTPDAGDFVYGAFAHSGASSDMTINSELSNELSEIGGGTHTRRLLTAYDSSPDASPTPGVTWTGAEDAGAIAFILNAAAGSQSNAPRAMHYYRTRNAT